jgi:hypothetical protein
LKPQNDVILKLLEIESKRSLESAKTKTKKLSASSQKSRKKIEQDEEPDNNRKNNVDLFKNNIFVEMEIAKRHDMPAPLISEILVDNIKKNSSIFFFILFL